MTFENENPFALRSTLEYEMPDFSRINDESYLPAFHAGCEEHLHEVHEIIKQDEVTFENTIVALERSGQMLTRVLTVFYNKSSADTSKVIDEIEAWLLKLGYINIVQGGRVLTGAGSRYVQNMIEDREQRRDGRVAAAGK